MCMYDPPMTFTILSGRWVGNTGCPTKLSTKDVLHDSRSFSRMMGGREKLKYLRETYSSAVYLQGLIWE
jgi:hypothetical protein